MPEVGYRFRIASGVPVIATPAEIDVASAYQLHAALLQATAGGHATVVVDLAGTRFCDSAGLNLLLRAHKRARAEGGELRLVIPAGVPVLRIFTVTGLGRVIPQFDSLGEALAAGAAERRWAEATLAGLRFVRNRIGREAGLAGLIDSASAAKGRVTGWTWKPAPQPALGHLPSRGRAWEMARYRAYQAVLAGRTIGETFRQAVAFLTLTGANAASTTMISTGIGP
jgi:anti-anti-sigma factor